MHEILDIGSNVLYARSISQREFCIGSGESICNKTVKESSGERRARNSSQH